MITPNNTVVKLNTANLAGQVGLFVKSEQPIVAVNLVVHDSFNNKKLSMRAEGNGYCAEGQLKVETPQIWSMENPFLYRYELQIAYADSEEKVCGHFGFRTVSHSQDYLLLNGDEIYVRGYIRGARAHEHLNLLGVSNAEFYRKNIRMAKSYGFNLIRFHSVVPDEEFFEVADQEGIMVHLELRMPDDAYNNLEEMLHSKKELISDAFILQTVNKLYNHPSLVVYCIGNEIKNLASGTRVEEIGQLIKHSDPSRLYLDTSAWGEAGRPLVDIDVQHMGYYFPYGKHDDMFANTENLLVVGNSSYSLQTQGQNSSASAVIRHKVPLLAHEVCHYVALRDFEALKQKFIQYKQPLPWWIDEELKLIEQKGMKEIFAESYLASKYFQKECWKTAFESMRASKILAGFHFLQFADTDMYENSNGIVDCFDDPTYVTPEEFLRFNGDKVLLTDLDGRILSGGTTKQIVVSLSSCGKKVADFADITYKLSAENEILCQGRLEHLDVSQNGVYQLCKMYLQLPNLDCAKQMVLQVELQAKGSVIAQNEWNLWLFPQSKDAMSYREFVNYEQNDVVVTDKIEYAFDKLEEGKRVCLVYRQNWTRHLLDKQMPNPSYAFRATWNRFKPVIWDRGTNLGGLCDDKLLTKYGFATKRHYDFNYSILTEDCDKIILDDFPVKPKIILRGTDKHCRDRFDAYKVSFNLPELMPDRTLRNFAYLFEVNVGKGNLVVCGLNMTGLDRNEPSTVAMANCILQYMRSDDFAPACQISLSQLKEYMQRCAQTPVKERMMTQYWQLDDAPVESKQYWADSRAYLIEEQTTTTVAEE